MRFDLFFLAFGFANCIFDSDFIQDYFQYKFIRRANLYTCNTKKDKEIIFKSLLGLTIPMSVKDVSENVNFSIDQTQQEHIGIFLDGDCPDYTNFFEQCNTLEIFDATHHWIIAAVSANIFNHLQDLNMNINTDIKVGVKSGNRWTIFDVYSPSRRRGFPVNITHIGSYTKPQGFDFPKRGNSFYEDRRNMTGMKFKTLTVLPMKFEGTVEDHVRSDEHLEINHFNRQHALLHIYCGDYFNFSLTIHATDSWGYIMPNGSYDGVVGGLQSKTIDFGGSPIFLVKERYSIVDYGRRTWRLGSAFIFRHPRHKASFQVFLRPLEGIVWLVVICSVFTIILILRFVIICERRVVHSGSEVDSSWSSLVLFIIGALCQQGSQRIPVFLSGRIITFFVFVFAVLLYQFYSGSIVSYLLLQPTKSLTTIRQLAYSDLKIGCENILYTKQYFKQLFVNKDMDRLKHKKYKPDAPFYIPAPVGLELVAKGGYAFHVELATAYPIIDKTFSEDAICELEEIPFFEARPVMSAFPKKSPFRDAINFCLQKMGERGILHRQKKHYHARRPACIRSRAPASAVGLDEFYPALVILAIGILLSLVILLMENFYSKMQRRPRNW